MRRWQQPSGCIRRRCRSGVIDSPSIGSMDSVMPPVPERYAPSPMKRSKRWSSTRSSPLLVPIPTGRRGGLPASTGSPRPPWPRSGGRSGLTPWQQDTFKVSTDPDLIEKVRDLVGLYMNPPEAAAVFAVDEKPQIQALNRTAPTLPLLPTTPGRATHDYVRHGTVDLFAALDIARGTVISDIRTSHNQNDFIAFLNKIDREVPGDLDVQVILDNLSTHKTPKVQRWILRHRRFHLHSTPSYGSWMNLVERWSSALTTKKLKRSAHCSAKELAADIQAWVDTWNVDPRPFVWHKTAEQILERLAGYCSTINQGASACHREFHTPSAGRDTSHSFAVRAGNV